MRQFCAAVVPHNLRWATLLGKILGKDRIAEQATGGEKRHH